MLDHQAGFGSTVSDPARRREGCRRDHFAARLRELREGAGLTQRELAEATGSTVLKLCQALGVDCTAFSQAPAPREPQGPGRPRKAGAVPDQVKGKKPKKGRKLPGLNYFLAAPRQAAKILPGCGGYRIRAQTRPSIAYAPPPRPRSTGVFSWSGGMPLSVSCPFCDARTSIPDRLAGKDVRCPRCNGTFSPARPVAPKKATLKVPETKPNLQTSPQQAIPPSRTVLAEAEQSIRYTCPVCRTSHESPVAMGGQKANCRSCGQRLQIPQAPATHQLRAESDDPGIGGKQWSSPTT